MINRERIGFGLDLEGPLVNLEKEGHHAAHLRCARAVGVELTLEEAIITIPHFIGGPDSAVAEDIYNLGNKSLSKDDILTLKNTLFDEWIKGIPIIPTRIGLFEFLEEARRRDIPMAIGTATAIARAASYIERSILREFFARDQIVFGEDIKNPKPAPDVYLETARINRVNPINQIVFEDSPRGTRAGVAAGSIVVGLPVYFLEQTIRPLKEAGATLIHREWAEVDLDYLLTGELQSQGGRQRFLD